MSDTVALEPRDGALLLTLGRPDRPTALSPELIGELREAVRAADQDPDIRVVVLKGQPRWFCVGADLGVYVDATDRQARVYLATIADLFLSIWNSPKIFVAAVAGLALGGGAELALWTDLRLATSTSEWGFPEVTIGALPGAGGAQLLPRLIGLSAASSLVLGAERITGSRAHALGLTHAEVADDGLDAYIDGLVARFSVMSPAGLAAAKSVMHTALDSSLSSSMASGLDAMHLALLQGDAVEGVTAFFERRTPNFPSSAKHLFPQPPTSRSNRT